MNFSKFYRLFSILLSTAIFASFSGYAVNAVAKKRSRKYKWIVKGKVNINTGSIKKLSFLPGIGRKKAKRIIAYRSKRRFNNVVQLRKIKGIGRKLLARIRRYVTTSGETTISRRKIKRRKND